MADPRAPTVFLSYASENRAAARRIGAALPDYGLEVWYDESELGGGDAWDQKIRKQIRDCDYFMPLISAQTEARREGYFRREWRLAVERTLDMADDHRFLLPIVIDDTDTAQARVPEKFFSVQWLKVPDGNPTPALETMCRRLVSGEVAPPTRAPRDPTQPREVSPPAEQTEPDDDSRRGRRGRKKKDLGPFVASAYPVPAEGKGKDASYWLQVLHWGATNSWALFTRLPSWIRWVIIAFLMIQLFSHSDRSDKRPERDPDISPETQKKINDVATRFQKDPKMGIAQFGALVAKEFGDAKGGGVTVLALPFTAPDGDEAAKKLAEAAFAQSYTRISMTQHGKLIADDASIADCDAKAMLERGKLKQTQLVLCGHVGAAGPSQALSVSLVDTRKDKPLWSGLYPIAAADPAKVALDVAAQVPDKDDED
jgi:hypothetical protein